MANSKGQRKSNDTKSGQQKYGSGSLHTEEEEEEKEEEQLRRQ